MKLVSQYFEIIYFIYNFIFELKNFNDLKNFLNRFENFMNSKS